MAQKLIRNYTSFMDRKDVLAGEPSVFSLLAKEEKIVVLRQVDEIFVLRREILKLMRKNYSLKIYDEIKRFFEENYLPDNNAVAALVHTLKLFRNCRFISGLFADLISECKLPRPTLVDAGHARICLLPRYDDLRSDKSKFSREDFVTTWPHDEFDSIIAPHPVSVHRDLDYSSYTFQMNFWFPLHDVEEKESLLLFPEAYKKDLPSYAGEISGDRDDAEEKNYEASVKSNVAQTHPDEWGYGPSVQIPLKIGDMILFHSQQFHGSPNFDLSIRRLTFELRSAGGCLDDNASYRRHFWNINSFLSLTSNSRPDDEIHQYNSKERSVSLLESRGDNFQTLISRYNDHPGQITPQHFVNAIFSDDVCAQKGTDINSSNLKMSLSKSFKDFPENELESFISQFPFAEDQLIALSRAFFEKGSREVGQKILEKSIDHSKSYFWTLIAGQLCLRNDLLETAKKAFTISLRLAHSSSLKVYQYSSPLPDEGLIGQLMPDSAVQAAASFYAEIADLSEGEITPDLVNRLDSRLFFPRPHRRKDLFSMKIYYCHTLWVGFPKDYDFQPQSIVYGKVPDLYIDENLTQICLSYMNDNNLSFDPNQEHPLLIAELSGFNIIAWEGKYYGVFQRVGPIDFHKPIIVSAQDTPELKQQQTASTPVLLESMGPSQDTPGLKQQQTASTPVLLESMGPYNIVAYRGLFYGLPKSLGEVDWESGRVKTLPGVVTAPTLKQAKGMVCTDVMELPGTVRGDCLEEVILQTEKSVQEFF